ncbi:uncharacterized protein LOC131889490 [Tigriopus californicus]|uniref:uncharacterized protein LOC131889490 n=1 Tax=Tigriopus californicus TaxID=6832 RepID=UPI0027D9F0DD|nr:uncharacterized protein LOC131889490 [Tigriopus californicus]
MGDVTDVEALLQFTADGSENEDGAESDGSEAVLPNQSTPTWEELVHADQAAAQRNLETDQPHEQSSTYQRIQEQLRLVREDGIMRGEDPDPMPTSSSQIPEITTNPKEIKYVAPGLKLFDATQFLNRFKSENLNLEDDFHYRKRSRLLELGIRPEDVQTIFQDDLAFHMFLAPESSSALIGSESDFRKICDYLFFFCCSCPDEVMFMLYERSIFDLLRNYAFKWELKLEHIITALANLGVNEGAMLPQNHVQELISNRMDVLETHARARGRSFSFKFPSCLDFFKKRRQTETRKAAPASNLEDKVDSETRLRVIEQTIKLISDLVVGYPDRCEFKASSGDWLKHLLLVYIFGVLSSDQVLIRRSFVATDIMMLYQFQIDSFSTLQWTGQANPADSHQPDGGTDLFTLTENASIDMAEVLARVGSHEGIEQIRTWSREELPACAQFDELDHHHNMVRRLQFLPPSLRGNQLKKNVAFLNLQQILNLEEMVIVAKANVSDLSDILQNPNNWPRLARLESEHYAMMTCIRLMDVIVGSESSDFTDSNWKHIMSVKNFLSYTIRQRDDIRNPDSSRVKELAHQIFAKWSLLGKKDY